MWDYLHCKTALCHIQGELSDKWILKVMRKIYTSEVGQNCVSHLEAVDRIINRYSEKRNTRIFCLFLKKK